jgi:hypothetical protein
MVRALIRQKSKAGSLKSAVKQGIGQVAPATDEMAEMVHQAREALSRTKLRSLAPLLPLLLNLKGEPFTLDDHFVFEPFFATHCPRNIVEKCGRQVAKSTSAAAQGVIQSACLKFFNTLFVTPLYEAIRRFSGNYVRGFIEQSPVKSLFVDSACYNNVLQRSFITQSTMHFSFAFLDCDRTRGLNCDKIHYDEYQDFDPSFPAIICETMSGSKLGGFQQFTGTPKTHDGPLEGAWLRSSQAEWCIKCQACGHWNIPSIHHDLEKMLGPLIVKRKISEESPGIICAKCQRPIFPRTGHWVHANKALRYKYAGYHIPQIIMPMHYADPEKWAILQGKRQGFGNTPINVFWNEVLGESYDTGAKLITITDLKRAGTLGPNGEIARVRKAIEENDYIHQVLAVDWGGGGEDEISFTTVALVCMLPDGRIHIPFGWRSLTPHDHNLEAERILKLMVAFNCSHIVHDFNGAGDVRETLIVNSGLDSRRSMPITYIRAASGPIMRRIPYNPRTQQREHYRVDKNRSLQQLALLIKFRYIRFFEYDYKGVEQPGLLHDFLSLVEDRVDSRTGLEIQTVIQNKVIGPDDFAQAVNMGVCALFHRVQRWPNLSQITKMEVPESVTRKMHPVDASWGDD